MLAGYWKFHRKMEEHAVWTLPPAQLKVWLTILNNANYRERIWWDGNTHVTIHKGELPFSQRTLADKAGVGRQVVRDTISALVKMGCITTQNGTHKGQMICVVNWGLYNGADTEENPEENPVGTHEEPSRNPTIRRKEGKKKNLPPELPLGANGNGHDPRVRRLVLYWYEGCQRERKFKPPETWAKDGALTKTMLRGREGEPGFEDVQFCMHEFLVNPPHEYHPQTPGRNSGKCTLQAVLNCMDLLLQRKARR